MKFLRRFFREFFKVEGDRVPPTVGGYMVDYAPLTNEQIAAPLPEDELWRSGEWEPVNRRR